jgi:hypothetical protein
MRFSLKDRGPVLATRPIARKLREEIEKKWLAGKDPSLELDFDGLVAISPSCADELIGRLYSELADGELGDRAAFLLNLSDDHEAILAPILKRRAVIAPKLTRRGVVFLGAPLHLGETYRLAKSLREFRAADLAAKSGLSVPAANNRLAKLLRTHLLRRTETSAAHGGREYLYSVSGEA